MEPTVHIARHGTRALARTRVGCHAARAHVHAFQTLRYLQMDWPVIVSAYSEGSSLLWRLESEHSNTTVRLRPRRGQRGGQSQCKLTIQGKDIDGLFSTLYGISLDEGVFDVDTLAPPLIWRRRLEERIDAASGLVRSDFSLGTLPPRPSPEEASWSSSEGEHDRGDWPRKVSWIDLPGGGQTPHGRRRRGGGQTPHVAADERRPDNCPADGGYVGRALEMLNRHQPDPGAAQDLGWFGESMSTF